MTPMHQNNGYVQNQGRERYDPQYNNEFNGNAYPNPEDRYYDERVINKAELCETDYKFYLTDWLDEQLLSMGCRKQLKKTVMMLFDKSTILAKLSPTQLTFQESVLKARLLLNLGIPAYKPSDMQNPQLVSVHDTIIHLYQHYISPAEMGGERRNQHTFNTQSENTQTQIIKDARMPERRGFSFLGMGR